MTNNAEKNHKANNTQPVTVTKKQHLDNLLKQLPKLPGVYKMLNKTGDILYVGKAKSLKNRVSSYFSKSIEHPKTLALVARITHFEVIVTRSETEALLLEQNLIKENRPPYNVMLRDDKSYLYVFMSADKYPRLSFGRGKRNHKKGHFFGPFPQAQAAKDTLEIMQKLFQVRQCENAFFKQRTRPCLQYQIKRCRAPCVELVSHADYQQDVQNTLKFLSGNSTELDNSIIAKMEAAAEALDFEKAVIYRDQLAMLRQVQAQQAVYTVKGEADVFAINMQAGVVSVYVLTVRGGRMLGGKHFYPDLPLNLVADVHDNETKFNQMLAENLADFIMSFYRQVSDDLPSEIITSHACDNSQAMQTVLGDHYDKKVIIKHQVREVRAEWLTLAKLNTTNALKTKLSTHRELTIRYQALADVLGRKIDRIECFDISHTMGEATIASCVVFDTGGMRKRDYRQYAIHGIQGGDDYAAMTQALTRRYKKQDLPDLLLIDGGKGQLSSTQKVMDELGKKAFMVGVSKGEGRKAGLETLHLTDGTTINLASDHKALHLIQQVRDEAHRFAITKHRAKRDKKRSSSVLEVIPGLGEKRRRELLNHFGGMQGVLNATENEIEAVNGIGKVLAHTIYSTLHG